MTDIEQKLGNVPTENARALVREMIQQAQTSADPERYWTTLLALAGSAMAAQVSQDAAIRALTGTTQAAMIHRDKQRRATRH